MSNSKYIYPDCGEEDDLFSAPSDYQPLLSSLGNIVIKVDDQGYQGDSRILFEERRANGESRFGFLTFGWGSCSGCDALQGCRSYKDIDDLRDKLASDIKWLLHSEMLTFFKTHDWQGDFNGDSDEQKRFVRTVIAFLSDQPNSTQQ